MSPVNRLLGGIFGSGDSGPAPIAAADTLIGGPPVPGQQQQPLGPTLEPPKLPPAPPAPPAPRPPAPANFNARAYLAANPDVAASGVDPYQHWTEFGQAEGRQGAFAADAPDTPVAPPPTAPTATGAADMPTTTKVNAAANKTLAATASRAGRSSTRLTTQRRSAATAQSPAGGTIAGGSEIYSRRTLG